MPRTDPLPAAQPDPVPALSNSGPSRSSGAAAGDGRGEDGGGEGGGGEGGGGGDGGGPYGGMVAGQRVIGVLDNSGNTARPVRIVARGVALAQLQLNSALPEVHPNLPPLELILLIHGSEPQYPRFEGNSMADWSVKTAFNDESSFKPQQKEQFTVLLNSAQMGGIAFSVGVVWWASRVTGVLGSLLASMPAWRQLDPLPVVGRDEEDDEIDWHSVDERIANAEELAISMILERPC
jgi:hypothetical protein